MRRLCAAVVMAAVVTAGAEDAPRGDAGKPPPPPTSAPASTAPPSTATPPAAAPAPEPAASAGDGEGQPLLRWDEADRHVGETVTVAGKVVDVHCSPLNCLLAFEPSFNRFTAVVPVNRFDVFPPDRLQNEWKGKDVRVTGRIVDNGHKPEIVVQSADSLWLSYGQRRRERDQRRQDAVDEQQDTLDRLDDALARVEALTNQLAQSEARLENLMSLLDQRMAALAQMQASSVPPEPTPPEPRTWEGMRTIKRGMAARDVVRLAGEPARIEQGSNGWQIWYYDTGQTISFDRRGRVQSSSGFASP